MDNSIQPNDFYTLISIGIVAMLLFAIGLIVVFFTSQRKLLNEKMQQQQLELKHQQDLLFATIKTQEEERKRIAEDLHDEIGAKLSVTLLNLRFLGKQVADVPSVKEALQDVGTLLNTTIDTTRRISHDLLPPVLDKFGLVAALNELRDSYLGTAVSFDFDTEQVQERLEDKLVELNLFRVIQELLKNSVSHGEATHIQLRMNIQPPSFDIQYEDNGKGFDLAKLNERKGLGTQNIESRLNMCGASIQYTSSVGKGVKIDITKTVKA